MDQVRARLWVVHAVGTVGHLVQRVVVVFLMCPLWWGPYRTVSVHALSLWYGLRGYDVIKVRWLCVHLHRVLPLIVSGMAARVVPLHGGLIVGWVVRVLEGASPSVVPSCPWVLGSLGLTAHWGTRGLGPAGYARVLRQCSPSPRADPKGGVHTSRWCGCACWGGSGWYGI